MKVAVVGATGVLGRALIPMLLRQGYAVRALARSPERVPSAANLEVVQCDLLSDEAAEQLPGKLSGCDAILHIATAILRNPAAPGAWQNNTRLRTAGVRRLLDAARAAGAKYYVQQSIIMAYPDGGDRWLDEHTPLDTSPARKGITEPVVAMEGMVRATEQPDWCILRGGAFVGPDTSEDQIVERLRRGDEVVPCAGHNFISPIHVDDMAAAFVAALGKQPARAVFNIVDEPLRQGDYLDRLASLIGAPPPRRNPDLPCPPSWRCTNQAARMALGWTPSHGIWPTR